MVYPVPRNDEKNVLLQVDDLDPVRLRAHRVVADRLQFAARLVDRVDRHPGRVHADRQQELAARVDREAARRLLGREAADLGQGALVGVDLVADQHAGLALGAVEELAVRRHMDSRGRGLLLVFVGIDELQLLQGPRGRVDRIAADRRRRLGDQIGEPPIGVEGQVAWARTRLGGDLARPVWRYRAGGRIELQLHHDVAAEHRNVNVLVAGIDDHAMRLGLGVEDLGRFRLDDALRVDRVDRQLGADIGGGEQKFAGAVGVDVRHLVDQTGLPPGAWAGRWSGRWRTSRPDTVRCGAARKGN